MSEVIRKNISNLTTNLIQTNFIQWNKPFETFIDWLNLIKKIVGCVGSKLKIFFETLKNYG